MPRKKNVIAPEAQTMDLVLQKKEENLSVASQILKAFNVLQGQEYGQLLYIQTGKSMFQLHQMSGLVGGAVLLIIREKEQHGAFLEALKQIGIHPRKAQRYMNYANRFGKYDKLSHLNNSKLDLLEELTDPELEKLNAGEEVNGMTLDDWDTMTATQIRDRGRAAEEKAKALSKKFEEKTRALEAIIKEKSAKLDDLDLELRTGETQTKEKKAEKALQQYRDPIIDNIHVATDRINRAIAAIDEAQKIPHVPFDALEKLVEPWQGSFLAFLEAADDFNDAFKNIHVDKGRG